MSEPRDYAKIAANYARDVLAGRIMACALVKRACQRYVGGLRAQRSKDYPYRLDKAAIAKVCRFVELMPHVKGKWAREKQRLHLEAWQIFIYANVFGWKRKRDGLRRFRRVYVEVPRKNSKSTMTAAAADYMLVADGEHGAEVYSGATTEKQAWEVFGPARLMVLNTPELREHYGVTVGAKNLHVLGTASKFEPIIGKPGDGASPSFAVTDEYHEHTTPEQYETMLTGMGAREQPIAWVITTAGSDTAGPCYALRQQAMDMLEGKAEYDDLFGIVYTIDDGDDWTSLDALRKANPNIGVSVSEEFLRTAQLRAISDPREQSIFKTKHLDVWVTAASPYFNAEAWKRLGDLSLTREEFRGEPCVVAFDLASKLDLTAKVTLFSRVLDDEKRHYYVFGSFYIPESQAEKPENAHYRGWVKQNWLTATPGETTDYAYIEGDIVGDAERHDLLQVGCDPHNAGYLITRLQDKLGADRIVEVPQQPMHLSEPMKEIQAAIQDGRMHHDGNPVMAWCIGNVTAQSDRNENVFPRKERAERKIDGAVALINAMNRAVKGQVFEQAKGSIYETRGIITL